MSEHPGNVNKQIDPYEYQEYPKHLGTKVVEGQDVAVIVHNRGEEDAVLAEREAAQPEPESEPAIESVSEPVSEEVAEPKGEQESKDEQPRAEPLAWKHRKHK